MPKVYTLKLAQLLGPLANPKPINENPKTQKAEQARQTGGAGR